MIQMLGTQDSNVKILDRNHSRHNMVTKDYAVAIGILGVTRLMLVRQAVLTKMASIVTKTLMMMTTQMTEVSQSLKLKPNHLHRNDEGVQRAVTKTQPL